MAEPQVDVSVIVAVRNGAPTLRQCIESVLGQQCCTVELIIVDAMSDDGTREIVESYGDRVAIYIREPDRGIYDAWNKALAVTRGEWCAFLGADDLLLAEGSLAALLRTAREPGPVPVFVYGGILRVGGAEDYVLHPNPADARKYLRSGRMLPHPGSLHRVATLREIGGFDDSLLIAGDLSAVLSVARRGPVLRCNEVVAAMRVGGVSETHGRRAGLLRAERLQIMKRERGWLIGSSLVLLPLVRDRFGRGCEVALTRIFGSRRGGVIIRRLRRSLGRRPVPFNARRP